jgi:hypothetical protein
MSADPESDDHADDEGASEYTIESGRAYQHAKCGNVTRVSGNDFAFLCNPFALCTGTMCVACGAPDALNQFAWVDTGESLTDYRRRLRQESPFHYFLAIWLVAPIIGASIGAGGGAIWAQMNPANGALPFGLLFGAAVGVLIFCLFVSPKILNIAVGDRFYKSP